MLSRGKQRILVLGCALLVFSLAFPARAVVSTPGSGGSDGSGGVSNSIPIVVPPGTAGFVPSIALSYSSWSASGAASLAKPDNFAGSRSGNGLAGVGWSISGLSVITRCAQTISTDNATGAVLYDANDRFCLDGQRLVTVGTGAYGADQTEYRTEVETMTKIVSVGSSGSGPAWFKVWLKSGLILELGNSASSRIAGLPNGSARAWAVNKVSDRFGNYYTVTWYQGAASLEYVPSRIDYTGNAAAQLLPYNSIQFRYENRPDTESYYAGGVRIRDESRLTSIATYADDALVKDYRVAYNTGPTTGRSRVSSITECAGDGACLGPLTFTYEAGGGQVQTNPGNLGQGAVSAPLKFLTGDFNGDGYQDVLMADTAGFWRNCYGPSLDASGCSAWWGQQGNSKPYVLDYNGDGISDLAVHQYDGQLMVCPGPNPTPWVGCFPAPNFNRPVAQYEFFVLDVLGDGRHQLVGWDVESYAGIRCDIVNLALNGWCENGAIRLLTAGGFKSVQGDFDGDGREDIISFGATEYRSCNGKAIASSGWCTTVPTATNWRDLANAVAGDFNGDGKSDVMLLSTAGMYFCAGPGVLTADNCVAVAGMAGNNRDAYRPVAGDFTGDGVADLILIHPDVTYLCSGPAIAAVNNCSVFSHLGWSTALGVGDFNGDGSADAIATNGTTSVLASGAVARPDLMVSASSPALGVTTTFAYRPLTDAATYTKGAGMSYPMQETRKPLYVVSQTGTPNGIGGTNMTNFRYEGGRVNLAGRGFAGFETTRMHDTAAGRETIRRQLQSFPHEGRVHELLVYVAGQQVYNKTRTIGNLNTIDNRPSSWAYSETEISHGLDGKWLSERRAYGYDGYLNVICVQSYKDAEESTRIAEEFKKIACNEVTNDRAEWLIAQPTSKITRFFQGQTEVRQTTTFTPRAGTLAVQQEVREPDTPELRVVSDYSYDVFGNLTGVVVAPTGMQTRTNSKTFDSRGRYATASTNALGHTTSKTVDARFGAALSVTDPNGLVTAWQYDAFGRKTRETRPDATFTTYAYTTAAAAGGPNPNFKYYVTSTHAGQQQPTYSYYDAFGRNVLFTKRNFADTGWVDDKNLWYDAQGRLSREYLPYDRAAPLLPFVETGYDALGRVSLKAVPGKGTTTYTYSAQPGSGPITTTARDAKGQESRRVHSIRGDLMQITDALNKTTLYQVSPMGLTSKITDAAGNDATMTYNRMGWMTSRVDPDWGSSTNAYDALGQLVSTTDAKAQVKTMGYDRLGRKTTQVDATQSGTWTYDPPMGAGRIASSTSSTGPQNNYYYDSMGRLRARTYIMDGIHHEISHTFDAFGRIASTIYPGGFAAANVYDANAYLKEVRRTDSNALLWRRVAQDASGSVDVDYGNGTGYSVNVDHSARLVTSMASVRDADNFMLSAFTYGYDALGNVTSRQDTTTGLSETYAYDSLNRLTSVSGSSPKLYEYDFLGNIVNKSDVTPVVPGGAYSYIPGNKPHAVRQAGPSLSFTYDANGNMASGAGRTTSLNAFNLPTSIQQGASIYSWTYDADQERVKFVSPTQTKVYLRGAGRVLFEKVTLSSGVVESRSLIYAGEKLFAQFTQRSNGVNDFMYFAWDKFGSLSLVTDGAGQMVEKLAYDAFGKRRSPNGADDTTGSIAGVATAYSFTGHEYLDALGLIHMNGRLYDPKIARFLSPDPHVTQEFNPQNLNRYSYAVNNPFAYTDPTGLDLQEDDSRAESGPGESNVQSLFDKDRKPIRAKNSEEAVKMPEKIIVEAERWFEFGIFDNAPCTGVETAFSGGMGGMMGSGVPGPAFAFPAGFVGGGVALGWTTSGRLFVQIQGVVAGGAGMFIGLGAQGGISRAPGPGPNGLSRSIGVQVDANAGFGPSVGGSLQRGSGGDGGQAGIPGLGRFGAGVGAQASVGVVQTATWMSPRIRGLGGCRG